MLKSVAQKLHIGPKSEESTSDTIAHIIGDEGKTSAEIDLVFIVDETGSMGSYISSVQQNIRDIVSKIQRLPLCSSLRYGLIGYRDHCDPQVVMIRVPLTEDLEKMHAGVSRMAASGGGDYPEAVTDGFVELLRLQWRPNAAKTAVWIADAPMHGIGGSGDSYPDGCLCGDSWEEQVESCREMGITIHAVCCGCSERYVFEKVAGDTWGRCLDLSGAGSLPKLVTNCADNDLDKHRIMGLVLKKLIAEYTQLLEFPEEEDRLEGLLGLLREDNVKPRVVANDSSFDVKEREIEEEDIKEAICSIRRQGLWDKLPLLFPKIGLSGEIQEKGGLFNAASTSAKKPEMVPLLGVEVNVNIVDFCCEVEVAQTYKNDSDRPIEAVYKFPIDELAGVCGFVAEIDDKRIYAECQEKKKARKTYEAALASGQGAYLLEQKKGDVFEMSVGNLNPGKTVKIRITYVTQLEKESDAYRFVLPTTVAPRYMPPEQRAKGKQRADAPVGAKNSRTVPYALRIAINAEFGVPIASIESPSHEIVSTIDGRTAKVGLKHEETEMNGDLVLYIKEASAGSSRAFVEQWDDPASSAVRTHAAMVVFAPQFEEIVDRSEGLEVDFVIDCSASMVGAQIDESIRAGQYFLNQLSRLAQDLKFNVGAFGTQYRAVFDTARAANSAEDVESARKFVAGLRAEYGGTQILRALKEIAESDSTKKAIIILTDGEVSNTSKVMEYIRSQSGNMSVYPIGIGHAVSHANIRGMARAGSGAPEFCLPGEDITPMVERHLRRIFSPLKNVEIDWSGVRGLVHTTPSSFPPVISNAPLICYALFDGSDNAGGQVVLKGTTPKGESKQWQVNIDIASSTRPGRLINRLAARSSIRVLEDNNTSSSIESKVVALATKYNLASKFTSFVAVEKREVQKQQEQQAERVDVPTAASKRDSKKDKKKEKHDKREKKKSSKTKAVKSSSKRDDADHDEDDDDYEECEVATTRKDMKKVAKKGEKKVEKKIAKDKDMEKSRHIEKETEKKKEKVKLSMKKKKMVTGGKARKIKREEKKEVEEKEDDDEAEEEGCSWVSSNLPWASGASVVDDVNVLPRIWRKLFHAARITINELKDAKINSLIFQIVTQILSSTPIESASPDQWKQLVAALIEAMKQARTERGQPVEPDDAAVVSVW